MRVRGEYKANEMPPTTGPRPTVVYIHGIGPKPRPRILKCQWDSALFGRDVGDRSRLAFWMNEKRHAYEDATCGDGDRVGLHAERIGRRALGGGPGLAPADPAEVAAALTREPRERRALLSIAAKVQAGAALSGATTTKQRVGKKVIPLPEFMRRFIARGLTELLLGDVYDFLYDDARRAEMMRSLRERLVGPGPFVVIAHSQGSMIAYQVLREMAKSACKVPLFVTIGSPLGLQEVQDELARWGPGKGLPVPACVERWVNFADRLDPVAADAKLANDFSPKGFIEDTVAVGLNPDSPRNPHSGTGYLSTDLVRGAVRSVVGSEFGQPVGSFVLARDLVRDAEDDGRARHPVLIQLVDPDANPATRDAVDLEARARDLIAAIAELVPKSDEDDAELDRLDRYVAAKLTRFELEELARRRADLRFERIWRNAHKRALTWESGQRVQAIPAHGTYSATGRGVDWAVLDTGITASHPHFARHANVAKAWNCTNRGEPKSGAVDGDGHGTHVAAIIAGEAAAPLSSAKTGAVVPRGMAPEARLHVYKVLDDDGNGEDAWIIKALDHVYRANEAAGRPLIAGVNLSLGGAFDPDIYGCGHSPLCQELRRLWRQGVIVVLAAGNEGFARLRGEEGPVDANVDLSISDPANLEESIAVGSVHRNAPHVYGVSYFSSRGPTADGRLKPDCVAPGEKIVSARHDAPNRRSAKPDLDDQYVAMSGTSMAAPHVAGLLAAFLSVRREFIGYPDRVKAILLESCTDLERDRYIQGRGLPNLMKMLQST